MADTTTPLTDQRIIELAAQRSGAWTDDRLFAFARAIESEVRASVAQGWKLVPIDPTPDMLASAVRCREGSAVYKIISEAGLRVLEDEARADYEAALSAAPRFPSGGAQ
jgi:hypothetical protein